MTHSTEASFGSDAPTTPHETRAANAPYGAHEEVNIVVTGFDQFGNMTEDNPAWSVARSLPSSTNIDLGDSKTLRANIHVRHPALHVAYESCHKVIDEIYGQADERLLLVLHVGVATARDYYSVERGAHRDLYPKPDVDGSYASHAAKPDYWKMCPPELFTNIDLDRNVKEWARLAPNSDLRISDDAGHYVCDYVYFCSLAYLQHGHEGKAPPKSTDTSALFLHIPPGTDRDSIQEGRAAALALIYTIIVDKLGLRTANGVTD